MVLWGILWSFLPVLALLEVLFGTNDLINFLGFLSKPKITGCFARGPIWGANIGAISKSSNKAPFSSLFKFPWKRGRLFFHFLNIQSEPEEGPMLRVRFSTL